MKEVFCLILHVQQKVQQVNGGVNKGEKILQVKLTWIKVFRNKENAEFSRKDCGIE